MARKRTISELDFETDDTIRRMLIAKCPTKLICSIAECEESDVKERRREIAIARRQVHGRKYPRWKHAPAGICDYCQKPISEKTLYGQKFTTAKHKFCSMACRSNCR